MTSTTVPVAIPAEKGLTGDLWGGLAAMLVALPSAIAFGVTIFAPLGGELAAQGALAGILGATALGLVAPAMGGSQRLITAPCAPAAAVLSALAINFTANGVAAQGVVLLLGLIGLLAGGIQIAFAFSGIGRLIRFIPYPVVSGYLSGVGLIIIGSQIPKLLGVEVGVELIPALARPAAWDWRSLLIGGTVIGTMVLVPRFTRAVPAAILALMAGIATYLLLGLLNIAPLEPAGNPLLVGPLSTGENSLPEVIRDHWQALRGLGMDAVFSVTVPALTLAVLLSIDTLKTCVVIDAMTHGRHDSNRELLGQGLGNAASALIGGIPGAGTMGASLINLSSGGHSKRSGTLAGGFSLLAYLLLAPLIAWVPVAALAAILIVIGARMIDRDSLRFFYSPTTRVDFAVIVSVILVAIFGNLIAASGVGVALAMVLFIREQTRSSVVRTRIEGREIFTKHTRTTDENKGTELVVDDTIVVELQGSLFFGTANQLQSALEPETRTRKYVILSMLRVQSLDVTATHVLEQIKDQLEERDACLIFCDIPRDLPSGLKMKRFLKETGVVRPTNKAFAFRQLDEALEWVETRKLTEQLAGNELEEGYGRPVDVLKMRIFAGVEVAQLQALEALVELRHVKAGKKVFKAGNPGGELFLVRHGMVKVTVPINKKDSYHMATCGPGDIIGGINFLSSGRHSADALAIHDVEVYVLKRDTFGQLRQDNPAVALAIVEHMARNLSHRLRVAVGEVQALRR